MPTLKQNNRILIVEDDASVRSLMTRHFRRSGFHVEQAGAAEEAVERFAAGEPRFDVVVTDIHLPGESGVELARRLQSLQPEQPIVFMTGDSDADMARRALQDGAAGYLLKPFEFFELDAVVNQAVQRNVVRSNRIVSRNLRAVRGETPAHVTLPAKVVLAPARKRHTNFAVRARVAVVTAALLALAWVTGAGISPNPVPAAPTQVAQTQDNRPVVVPVVIERSVYLNK